MTTRRQTVLAEVNKIFVRVFDDPVVVVTDATTAKDIPAWDSLNHTELIAAVEEHFEIKFSLREVMRFQKVGDMCDVIEAKLGD